MAFRYQNCHYQVRIKGDGEFDYFVCNPDEQESSYDNKKLFSARAYAKSVNGWVVKIIEEKIED
jgi:hypothetical protein